MEIGFDVISDLYLEQNDSFNWENKNTSLYCIIAGNISSENRTIYQTLSHLSKFYHGIFYIPGELEYNDNSSMYEKTTKIREICKHVPRVTLLENKVMIIDGVAIIGANGWASDGSNLPDAMFEERDISRYIDNDYLIKSTEKLQRHLDVKKMIMVTNAVPNINLYFGSVPANVNQPILLDKCLEYDTEHKIKAWVFGNNKNVVDTVINNVNYVSNPYHKTNNYWAKRISI